MLMVPDEIQSDMWSVVARAVPTRSGDGLFQQLRSWQHIGLPKWSGELANAASQRDVPQFERFATPQIDKVCGILVHLYDDTKRHRTRTGMDRD